MTDLIVKPVETRREKKDFLQLPWRLYEGDPNWIPPLRKIQKEVVGFDSHPFYNQAEGQAFLALRDGKAVGRVLAILNPAHNRQQKERRGFFGFFECEDDVEAAAGLFDAVRDWHAERDIHQLRGPTNPSLNYECGLLVEGFDSPPTFMMTYNPPYYERLITEWGYEKAQDLYAYFGTSDDLQNLDNQKMQFVVDEAKRRFNLKLRQLDTSRFLDELRMFVSLYNDSLGGTWGYAPLSQEELEHTARSLRRLVVPQLTAVAEVDGRPIGASFGLLDYNPRIKQIDGRLYPFGFLRLLYNRRAIRRARLIAANVIPEYQRWGVGLVLLNHMLPACLEFGIKEAEFSWVLESNDLSRKSIERGGARRIKTYRLFDWDGAR